MLRIVVFAVCLYVSGFADAETTSAYTAHEAPNGIRYVTPDHWKPLTLSQAMSLEQERSKVADRVEDELNQRGAELSEKETIFVLNWLGEKGDLNANLSFSISPVSVPYRTSQKEFASIDPIESDRLMSNLIESGPDIARAMQRAGSSLYESINFVGAKTARFGKWACIAQTMEAKMLNGRSLNLITISCPAGAVDLTFGLFVDPNNEAEAMQIVSEIIAQVDVSAVTRGGP